jgi:NADP-dependent 3-hydroxy acid dehydrogenase YdfG
LSKRIDVFLAHSPSPFPHPFDLSDPVAVITGGEGDFAKEISAQLKSSGYIVHAPGRRELDVRSAAAVEAWFFELERIDLLVNNAGITGDALLARQNPEGLG